MHNIKEEISEILKDLGIPANLSGYAYVRYAIELVVKEPEAVYGITKRVYPEVATAFKTTSNRVERAIRHAVETSCNRGNLEAMQKLFGYSYSVEKGKPTNSEFIATIADKLHIKYAVLP